MTVNELQNVGVENFGNPVSAHRITADDGYNIHTSAHADGQYTKVIIVPSTYDFSVIQILPVIEQIEDLE